MTVGVHEFWSFVLIFARVAAMMLTAPLFGDRGAPQMTKAGLAALCSLILLPIVSGKVSAPPADLITFIGALLSETAIGLAIGFLVQLLISAFQIAGYYVDTQMGFGIINILNPFTQQQTSAMGQFMYQAALTIFLIAGGHLLLIGALAASFATVTPGAAHFSGNLLAAITPVVTDLFLVAFKIAAPAAAVLMVVEVAFGIVARTVPQMNVFIVGMPIKIIVGVLTVALSLPVFGLVVEQMPSLVGAWLKPILDAAR